MIMKFSVTVFTEFIKISMFTIIGFFRFTLTFLTKSHLIVLIYDCFNFIEPNATIMDPMPIKPADSAATGRP